MSYKYRGASNSGANGWFFQRITGIVLFVLVLAHFYIAHRTFQSGHDWDTIIARLASPYMKMFYLSFVTLGVWHGLNGLWSVIRDYNISSGYRKSIFAVIFSVGIFIGLLGFITILNLPAAH
ncbi:MAG: succinate dehydrogenase, hydrophobic membrane anchor protein [Calditrichia bacterium]